ncbi:MAG TPA: XrtA system polysaccharide chain length determinant [Candidatus Angelobacter sp.]|jgi:polysaccharide chain length determinant protein (PEP-CTERM system associated)|nr:XrtA system polysaccharide chain length determinant [Candidatus Angelobacter sp.]
MQSKATSGSVATSGMIRAVIEKRWLVAACLVAGWAAGTAAGWVLPPKYRSETVILIEQQKIPEHYVESNITTDLQQRLQTMSEQILSRTRLLTLIEKFGLYGGAATPHDPEALVEQMRKDIKIEMITAEGRRDQLSAFKVSYSASKPRLAHDVTNELTSFFINENLRDREQLSRDTTAFLQSQLDVARQSLTEQEEKLRAFRMQHDGELPEQLQSNLQILGGLQVQLQAANDALSQAEQRNLYLRSLLHQYQTTGTPPAEGGGASAPLTTQGNLAALRAQLADLQGRYTEKYPDILRVKQQIAELEARQAKEVGGTGSSVADASTPRVMAEESSPTIQLRSELSANEFERQNEKGKIKRLEQQVEVYQSRLNLTPERQQQAAAVTRDYDQSRTYYESLLSKKLQSEMATELEMRQQGEQFRMIDPPSLPTQPYWPNRLALSCAGLAGGLVLGMAIAMLFELLRPKVSDESELAELIGPGYALALPAFRTDEEITATHRRHVWEAVAACALAVILPVITVWGNLKH